MFGDGQKVKEKDMKMWFGEWIDSSILVSIYLITSFIVHHLIVQYRYKSTKLIVLQWQVSKER
jgi:hypothetical protein